MRTETVSFERQDDESLADIDGVLGLDFFQDYKFCVDTLNFELSVTKAKKRLKNDT